MKAKTIFFLIMMKCIGFKLKLFLGLPLYLKERRPSRPIRCDVWIVERMRYPTDRPTDQPTDGHSQLYRCFVAPKKALNVTDRQDDRQTSQLGTCLDEHASYTLFFIL